MIFYQQMFLLSSILIGGLLHEQSIFNLAGSFIRKCAPADIQGKYYPLKFPNPYSDKIF